MSREMICAAVGLMTLSISACKPTAKFDDSEVVPIAAIKADSSSQVETLLEEAGIAATIDEGPVVYGISVSPRDKSKAMSVLRTDSAEQQYWIQFSDDQ